MPAKEHAKLVRSARKAGLTGKRKKAYVYGTLAKIKQRHAAKQKRRKR